MLYLFDQRDAEPEMCLALYRAALEWAAQRSDRFVLHIQPGVYEAANEVSRLLALGQVTQVGSDVPSDLVSRFVAKLFPGDSKIIQVEGTPGAPFTHELTRVAAPAKAISGDLSPVEDVLILAGERALFASYGYGRDLLLDLDQEEVVNLREALRDAGLEVERLIPAPPSMVSSS